MVFNRLLIIFAPFILRNRKEPKTDVLKIHEEELGEKMRSYKTPWNFLRGLGTFKFWGFTVENIEVNT